MCVCLPRQKIAGPEAEAAMTQAVYYTDLATTNVDEPLHFPEKYVDAAGKGHVVSVIGLEADPSVRDVDLREGRGQADRAYTLLQVTPPQWVWLQKAGFHLAFFGNVAVRDHPGDRPVLLYNYQGEMVYWKTDGEWESAENVAYPLFYAAVRTRIRYPDEPPPGSVPHP